MGALRRAVAERSAAGTTGFDDLVAQASVLDAGNGLQVPVVALQDLIRMNRASRRPKDQLALLVLEELADVLREQESEG